MVNIFADLNPLTNKPLLFAILVIAVIAQKELRSITKKFIGSYKDKAETEVEANCEIWYEPPEGGMFRKIRERKTSETQTVGDRVEHKIAYVCEGDKGEELEFLLFPGDLETDTGTRNGAQFQVHKLRPRDDVQAEVNRKLQNKVAANEMFILHLLGGTEMHVDKFGKMAGKLIKETSRPAFIPGKKGQGQTEGMTEGGEA
jgi:hypothetical protein